MKQKTKLRPSRQLRDLVRVQGGVCRASKAWGMHYLTLRRFLRDGHGISGNAVAALMRATRLSFGSLFVIVP